MRGSGCFRAMLARLFCFVLISIVASGCAGLNDPGYGYGGPYGGGPYGAPQPAYGGYYGNDPYYRREQQELQRERERLENERRKLERERERQPSYQPPPSRPQPERCPPGFSPSEQKCSREERRRGCRDMRLPGGLGCVSR